MTKKNVVIFGVGQQADIAQYYFEHDLGRKVIAFCFDNDIKEKKKNDLPIINLKKIKTKFSSDNIDLFVAIGGVGLNYVREYYYNKIKLMGFSLTQCISSRIIIPHNVSIGKNAFIDHGTSFMPFINIGENFSSVHSIFGHHSIIGDNVSIINANIGANTKIERNCFVSINASICSGVTIGEYSLIDIGSIVKKDVPPYTVVTSAKSINKKIDSRRIKLLGESYYGFQRKIED